MPRNHIVKTTDLINQTCLQGRVQAAKNMVDKLLRDAKVGEYVQEMKTLCDAYIQLANWNVSQYKAETSKFVREKLLN